MSESMLICQSMLIMSEHADNVREHADMSEHADNVRAC